MPRWGYHSFGCGPSVFAAVVLFILVILLLTGRLQTMPNLARQFACDMHDHVATNPYQGLGECHDQTNRDLRSACQTLQRRQRAHLVEQFAIDRCLRAKETDVALRLTEKV
ncbi:MAG: DUF3309 family protein [Deltaproteobacteria bacterium]|nr:DUF3309 family protein [Deltaproteobacteria bacterium]MBI2229949.1 DUF3309 family protein [Deltaproteobacteria bacterium]MBI2364980.1 DUF3309 family protein [Deltaproteobacteria bacterium]